MSGAGKSRVAVQLDERYRVRSVERALDVLEILVDAGQRGIRLTELAQRLEISIAPGAGRRYPNLADHKRNVEYDVNRVMRLLGNHFVVSDRLRAAGKWVVVPIRLADVKQTGAK